MSLAAVAHENPPISTRTRVLMGGLAVGLVGLGAAVATQLTMTEHVETAYGGAMGADHRPENSSSGNATTGAAVVADDFADDVAQTDTELDALLRQRFLKLGASRPMPLSAGLTAKVNVLNLWASWCEPCKRELPLLQELLESRPAVSFTALRVRDATPPDNGELSLMPEGAQMFIDPSEPSRALEALATVLSRSSLPTTLVIDCRHRLLWEHVGEITENSAIELANELEQAAMADIRCPRRRPRVEPLEDSPTSGSGGLLTADTDGTTGADPLEDTRPDELSPVATHRCGDDSCQARRGEDCRTCPQDCGCGLGYSCTASNPADATKEWRCTADVNQLRD